MGSGKWSQIVLSNMWLLVLMLQISNICQSNYKCMYDSFILDDTFLTKSFFSYGQFINLCLKKYNYLLLDSETLINIKSIFLERCFWLQFEWDNSNSNSSFLLYSHAQIFPIIWSHFWEVFTYYFVTGDKISFLSKWLLWNNNRSGFHFRVFHVNSCKRSGTELKIFHFAPKKSHVNTLLYQNSSFQASNFPTSAIVCQSTNHNLTS